MAVVKLKNESYSKPSWDSAKKVQVNKKVVREIKQDSPEKEKEKAIIVQTFNNYFKSKEAKPLKTKDTKMMKLSERAKYLSKYTMRKVAEGFTYKKSVNEDIGGKTYKFKAELRVQTDADMEDGGIVDIYDLYYNARYDQFDIVDDIINFVENYHTDDLIKYIDDDLKDIVESITLKVEKERDDLYLYTFVKFNTRPVSSGNVSKVYKYLIGQFSDGWGEDLEQTVCANFDYTTDSGYSGKGDIYVSIEEPFYAGVVKENKVVEDNVSVSGENEVKYNVYGWTLYVDYPKNRLYAGPRYWLYNPSGYGGALIFYSSPETIMADRERGKQVLGFEGNPLPKTVLDAIIRRYAKGKFDNRPLTLKDIDESKKLEAAKRIVEESAWDLYDGMTDMEYRLNTLRELGYTEIADKLAELQANEMTKRDALNSILDTLLSPNPTDAIISIDEPIDTPIDEPTEEPVDMGNLDVDMEVVPDDGATEPTEEPEENSTENEEEDE